MGSVDDLMSMTHIYCHIKVASARRDSENVFGNAVKSSQDTVRSN